MSSSTLRRRVCLALLGLAAALVACAGPVSWRARTGSSDELLREFREGRVRLDCASCRFEFRNAEWMLRDGHADDLVVAILRSGDGSGRSWYLLGRAAEQAGASQLALLYYQRSLSTPRNPIVALWPLFEDVNYRMRGLAAVPDAPPAARHEAAAPKRPVEYVTEDSVVVRTRPGQIGAFLLDLRRGDAVEVLDRSAEWKQVRLPDGREGWVYGRYTATRVPPSPRAPVQADAAPPPRKPAAAKKAPAPVVTAKASPTPAKPAAAKPVASVARATRPAAEPIAKRVPLTPAAGLGILGSPLPVGATLAGRSHGVAGLDDHPTETYAIPASSGEIVGFYEREMERVGWRKSYVSTEFLLYFVKDDQTLGVLIDREGGTFTLMGS